MTFASAQRLLFVRGFTVYRPRTKETDLFKVFDTETRKVTNLFEYQVIALAESLKRNKTLVTPVL